MLKLITELGSNNLPRWFNMFGSICTIISSLACAFALFVLCAQTYGLIREKIELR
jgi:hypothetical protein